MQASRLFPAPREGAGLKKRKAANGWVRCGAVCEPNALKKLEELKGSLGKNFSLNVKRSGSLQLPKSNINEHN